MQSRIYYTKPSITEKEASYVMDAVSNGWGDKCYEYIHRFEKLFADYLGVDYTIATSSCTGALHMGLSALGIGQGDEVIVADTNWIASVAPITYLGAKPIFVDILPDTWCINPDIVEEKITPRTKAILAVHLYGNLCEMDKLLEIGKRRGIPVIEDSAEAIGSCWQGKYAGTLGAFGVFSFHGTKTITTGEGGMFVTDDADLYEKVLTLSNHGRVRGQSKQFWPELIGFKYKMSNIQAAIGCAQMERIDKLVGRKRDIFKHYSEQILKIRGLSMNIEKPSTVNSYWMPTVVFSPETGVIRENLQKAFAIENIDARIFFWPLTSLPSFENRSLYWRKANPWAYDIAGRAINLPSYYDLAMDELDRVIDVIRSQVNEF